MNYKNIIQNYGNEIKTIKDMMAHIRKRPTMYIGYVGNPGYINMIREVFQNACDEVEKNESPADRVYIKYEEKTNRCTVGDNGRGIPFNDMFRIFATMNTSSNYNKKGGEFSSGVNGVGSKVTNALSDEFTVVSQICKEYSPTGKAEGHIIEFHQGKCTDPKHIGKPYKNISNYQGTIVTFTPDETIMGKITVTCEDVLALVSQILPLMKIGAIVDFEGIRLDGTRFTHHMVNTDGILTFLKETKFKPLIDPIMITAGNDKVSANIAITWDANGLDENEYIRSFANMCPTINNGSTHVEAFVDALSNYFRVYMNKIVLNNNSKLKTINQDIRAGLKAVVSVMVLEPQFSGQAKEILGNVEVKPFIKELINDALSKWGKEHSTELQKLCKFFKDVGTLRMKAAGDKITLLKSTVSTLTGLPAKYQKPTGKKNLELILVEGDSAMAPCRTGCDPARQGLFPLRGKVKNAMTSTRKDFFSNEECKAIYTILGCGEGRKCDPSKCKFDKIIFLGDADPDGLHIRTLLLKMFIIYYRPLVEAGRVYAAEPPLYSIVLKNKERQYFIDKADYVQYVYKRFAKYNTVKTSKGKKMSDSQIIDLLCTNINYLVDMNILAQNYAIEPNLLELIYSMIVHKASYAAIRRAVSKAYRYVTVEVRNGIMVVSGLVKDNVQTAVFNNNMIKDCNERILSYIINTDEDGYILNDNHVSLYELMEAFDKFTPPNLTRYKGLGEMNPNELAVSTLHPDYNRTLIRYTTSDIERDIEEMRKVDANFNALLQGVDIAGFDI